MFRLAIFLLFLGLTIGSELARAEPQTQVIKLFDEQLVIGTGEVQQIPIVRESTSIGVVRGARDVVLLSSTPDGAGIPNVDDFITVNGEMVQSGVAIPMAVHAATGIVMENTACTVDGTVSVNRCNFAVPHFHPVDISHAIPVGNSTVTVDIWDFGGGYGYTELYLIVIPNPLQ